MHRVFPDLKTTTMKKYINKTVMLYPSDTQTKYVKILDVNDFGIEVEILQLSEVNYHSKLNVGDIMFYPKDKLTFKIIK